MKKLRKRIYEIIEPAQNKDQASRIFDLFIIMLIILNILAVIVNSFKISNKQIILVLNVFEIFSIVIFTLEYFLRIYTSRFKYPESNIMKAIFRYIISPMALIDLFAILPFYLPLVIGADLRFLRILRLTRLLRILKINRYSRSLQLLSKVLKNKKEELVVTIFVTMILMLLAASIMYYLESDQQPDSFPNIVASFWWAIATLTTVGYGDVYPITILGKILAGIIALLGIGLVALPTGIISSGFLEEFTNSKSGIRKRRNRGTRMKNYRKIRLGSKKNKISI